MRPPGLFAVLTLVVAACAHRPSPPSSPRILGDDEREWQSDDIPPGTFDTCEALRTGWPAAPARDTHPIDCSDEALCQARTVQLVTRGTGYDPAPLASMLVGTGLTLVKTDADVVVEVRLDVDTHTSSFMPPCHPVAGCPEPVEQLTIRFKTRGAIRLLDRRRHVIASASLDAEGEERTEANMARSLTGARVAQLDPKLLRLLARHRGGAIFQLARTGAFAWDMWRALTEAPNDWSRDPVARGLLPGLLDDALGSGSDGLLSLVDRQWACAPEIAPRRPAVVAYIRAAGPVAEGVWLASLVPGVDVTQALCERGTAQLAAGQVDARTIQALRYRDHACVDRLLVDLAPHVLGPFADQESGVGIQFAGAIHARADRRAPLTTPEGALRYLGGQPDDIARAFAWLLASPDPRAAPLVTFPLYLSSTRRLRHQAITALGARGALADVLALAFYNDLFTSDREVLEARPELDHIRHALLPLVTREHLRGMALPGPETRRLVELATRQRSSANGSQLLQVLVAMSDSTSAGELEAQAAASEDPTYQRELWQVAARRCLPGALGRLRASTDPDERARWGVDQLLAWCPTAPP